VRAAVGLAAPRVAVGGVVTGVATLFGGWRSSRVTSLRVRLISVEVHVRPGSALPRSDVRLLSDEVVAAGFDLAGGARVERPFKIAIPLDSSPTSANVAYKVQVTADIPGVNDPAADVDLLVVEAYPAHVR